MQFEFIDNYESFVLLAEEWEELESLSPAHVFQSHRFVKSWYESAGKIGGAAPAIVVYREGGKAKGIFPACVIKRGMVKFLTWLGGFYIVDYGDILYDPAANLPVDDFIRKSLELLKEKLGFHLYYLHNVRSDAQVYPYLQRHFRPYRGEPAPYIRLTGDFESYLDSLKHFRKKQKSDTLRQIKRLSDLGKLEFLVVRHYDADLERVVRELIAQKKWRFASSGVKGVLFHPGYEEFYLDQARTNPSAHISCLKLDDAVIAVHAGYLYKKRLYYLMPSYDVKFGRYSPGRVLTYYLLQECYAHGVEVFDFCIGGEDYKYEWTKDEIRETSFVSKNIAGKAFLCLMKLIGRVEKSRPNGSGNNGE